MNGEINLPEFVAARWKHLMKVKGEAVKLGDAGKEAERQAERIALPWILQWLPNNEAEGVKDK